MWRYLRFALPALVLVALIVLFSRGLFLDPTRVQSPLVGKPAPAFTLPRLGAEAGAPFTEKEWQGRVALLNVWGSWCVACRDEHPVLMQFAAQHVLPIYGLDYKDQRQDALDWLAKGGDPYDAVAFDASGDVGINWGVYGAPETFLLDKHGVIRWKQIGPLTPSIISGELLPLAHALQAEP